MFSLIPTRCIPEIRGHLAHIKSSASSIQECHHHEALSLTECRVTKAWAASTWFWKFLPFFYDDQLPYIGLQPVLARYPDCWIGNNSFGSGYLEPTWTWVHFWESNRIGIERFHWGFGIGVGTDPLFYKIFKPKSNSWLVPSCDFNQNQIGFLITIF
jgi:hypothetical protein